MRNSVKSKLETRRTRNGKAGVAVAGIGLAVLSVTALATPALGAVAQPPVPEPGTPIKIAPALGHVEEHTELVTFVGGVKGMNLNFTKVPGHDVSQGQPWGGATSETGTNEVTVAVKTGVHATPQVATDFNNMVDQHMTRKNKILSYEFGISATDATPGKLSFAFMGDLTVGSNEYPVALGQGQWLFMHNWWMGGGLDGASTAEWHTYHGYLQTPDRKYVFVSGSNNYTFVVYPTAKLPSGPHGHLE